MTKKKKRSGCGGGGGGQQPKPAEECEEEKAAADDESCQKKEEEEDCDNKPVKETKGKPQGKKAAALPVVTAVLKVDMHCDGCAKRIRASVRHYTGVEGVALEVDKGSMTVVGRFDAKKLRDRVAKKTKKKVELVVSNNKGKDDEEESKKKQQQCGGEFKVHDYMYDFYWLDKAYVVDIKAIHDYHAKQNKDNKPSCTGGGGGGGGGKGNKEDNKSSGGGKGNNKEDNNKGDGKANKEDNKEDKGKAGKKPTVPVVGTVVLKIGGMGLHCDGCMKRVRAKLFKIKGVEQVTMDMAKNQVTVTGTMDIKPLPGKLQKKMRRPVDVVQANNKDKEKEKEKDGNKQQEGCKDAKKDKDNKQQQEGGGGCKDKDAKALNAEMLMWKTAFYDQHSLLNTEFMLSDDNPNACCVM
ncbi:hypothetical protein QOZ80_2BG0206040 [Eleusine coracana subsp. coracana]|nr:hypothetical protein QOZ80_2BG0206040 [Eleusine coracana subsp. coracana]